MKELTIEDHRAKRDELQAAMRAKIDRWIKVNTADDQAEIDAITKKIVELLP
jgi:hypothetical protein